MGKKCFIMGLPSAGKTTFLAALWHSINNNTVETKLKLNKIESSQYLSQLSQKWANAEPLERTVPSNEKKDMSLNLKAASEHTFDLLFPDLSGETFQKLYIQREISEELASYIKTADLILFFINVDEVKTIGFIPEHDSLFPGNSGAERIVRQPEKHDPLQVQAIELLQFILDLREPQRTVFGFLFSAWDLAKKNDSDIKPEEFMSEHMNMLWQFCKSNSDRFEYNLWGVSAQGGALDDKEVLLDKHSPIERIIVEDVHGNIGSDITLPLYSLMGEIE